MGLGHVAPVKPAPGNILSGRTGAEPQGAQPPKGFQAGVWVEATELPLLALGWYGDFYLGPVSMVWVEVLPMPAWETVARRFSVQGGGGGVAARPPCCAHSKPLLITSFPSPTFRGSHPQASPWEWESSGKLPV